MMWEHVLCCQAVPWGHRGALLDLGRLTLRLIGHSRRGQGRPGRGEEKAWPLLLATTGWPDTRCHAYRDCILPAMNKPSFSCVLHRADRWAVPSWPEPEPRKARFRRPVGLDISSHSTKAQAWWPPHSRSLRPLRSHPASPASAQSRLSLFSSCLPLAPVSCTL